jgi:hypothetical protein
MKMRFGQTGIGVLLCLTVVQCQTCWADSDSPFESKLAELAGRSAKQCRLVRLHHDTAEGWQCAASAERRNERFWFALQLQGEDSQVWMAALRTPSGAHARRSSLALALDPYAPPAPRSRSRVRAGVLPNHSRHARLNELCSR